MDPLLILAIGIITVLGLIIAGRMNAFLALIIASMLVSLLSPGQWGVKIARVATAFGTSAGGIGIVIALASIIGKCMLDSGSADRIVRAFTRKMGEKRAPLALMASGFVLAIPVFFDTVFYLLVPLARSLYQRTRRNYLLYLLAIGAGGAITHTLVPPTPGPLLIAANLGVDPGLMIMIGLLVAVVPALVGLGLAHYVDRRMPIPMRNIGAEPDAEPLPDDQLPGLWLSLAPVVLPVILISTNTLLNVYADAEPTTLIQPADIRSWTDLQREFATQAQATQPTPAARILELMPDDQQALLLAGRELTEAERASILESWNLILKNRGFYQEGNFLGVPLNPTASAMIGLDRERLSMAEVQRLNRSLVESAFPELIEPHVWNTPRRQAADLSSLFGNANLALLLSALIAIVTLATSRKLSRAQVAQAVELSLMTGGVIILITAAGGAFGAMLTVAGVGESIKAMVGSVGTGAGVTLLFMGFVVAAVFKIAQGSTTVSMITTSGMLAGLASIDVLGFHPVYLATAIGCGGLFGSWMNDSGFWVFTKMGALTEEEALKSWSIILAIMSVSGFLVTLVLATVMPLRG